MSCKYSERYISCFVLPQIILNSPTYIKIYILLIMKKLFFALAILGTTLTFAQNSLPHINVITVDGKTTNTSKFTNDGNPIVISFWATWCKPCMRELDAMDELYEEWQEDSRGFDFYIRNMYVQNGAGKKDYFKHFERQQCESNVLNHTW